MTPRRWWGILATAAGGAVNGGLWLLAVGTPLNLFVSGLALGVAATLAALEFFVGARR